MAQDGEHPILLTNWSIVLGTGEMCRPEEQDLINIHIKGYQSILYDGSLPCLQGKSIKVLTITSSIKNTKDGIFITKSDHRYSLTNDIDPVYKLVFGCLDPVQRLADIVQKKLLLL